jgi:outer membrane protein OmpA-like peptidoglycan-associated protein
MRDYVPAAEHYSYVYDLAKGLYPEAIYKAGLMYKMSGQYDKAIAAFQKFISDNPKTYKKLKKRAQLEIDGCIMGKNSLNNPIPATVKNVGPNVNSAYTELSPYPLGDTALLFATMKTNQVVDLDKQRRGDYVSRLMVSRKQKYSDVVDTFEWALPFNDGKFNDPKYHVGNACYGTGGDRFYFTRCLESKDSGMSMNCRIFYSVFEGEKWGNPQEVPNGVNEEGSSSTHPFFAKVGKSEILFFSSNRKTQGRGGYDIWYSVFDPRQKTYRRPQNAGKQINTVGDEMTPYFDSRTNKLYFASNGWKTLGGFDIYSAEAVNGRPSRYQNLQNLGYPVNTSADELYYIQDNYGKPDAYVVSNRPGSIALKNPTCCDDIWRIQYEPKIYVRGAVLNNKTKDTVRQVVVKMVDDAGNVRTYNSEDGNYEFLLSRGHNYVLNGDRQGYLSSRQSVNTEGYKREDPDDTIHLNLYMDSVYVDSAFRMENVYYDYDKATLRPESGAELEKLVKLMQDNPGLNVQINSYTDSKGTDEYNMNLSQERAQSVVNYLISGGIDQGRLTARGFGKADPAAPNKKPNGADDPEGRQLNRRTEFKITADLPESHMIFDSSKPGTIGEQDKNLKIGEDESIDSSNGNDDGQ